MIVSTIVVAVWAVACFFVKRIFGRVFVVASNFDAVVVFIFVVICAEMIKIVQSLDSSC